jgi:Calcineurin-like phosphoesterase
MALLAAVWGAGPASAAAPKIVYAVGDAQAKNVAIQNQVAGLIQAGGAQRLLLLGDLTDSGTPAAFQTYYQPSYGRFRAITYPTFGNHDVYDGEKGYNGYWGSAFRQANGEHYYSWDYGGWHFISLSSEEPRDASSAQYAWLKRDLAAHRGSCTIASVHRPRYSAGPQFNSVSLEPMYAALRKHAIVLLSGHAHNYQRMKPIRGLTQFVVGTGGGDLGNTDDLDPRLAASNDHVRGALRIELGVGGARFRFIDVAGRQLDSYDSQCVPGFRTPVRFKDQRPKAKKTYGALRTLSGRVRNVQRVRLTLVHRKRKGCEAFNGARFVDRSCKTKLSFPVVLKPPAFPGVGTYKWKYKVPDVKSLDGGTYRMDVRVRALDNKTAKRAVRFKVR